MSIEDKVKQMKQLYSNLEIIQDEDGSIVGMFQALDVLNKPPQLKIRWRVSKPTIIDIYNTGIRTGFEISNPKISEQYRRTAEQFKVDWDSLDGAKATEEPAEVLKDHGFKFEEPKAEPKKEEPKKKEPFKTVRKAHEASNLPAVKKSKAIIPEDMRAKQINELTVKDIKDYLAPLATEAETNIFLRLCQARGLNPFLREAYIIKYYPTTPAAFVIGKDGFATRAEKHPLYDGYEAGIIVKIPGETVTTIERRTGTFILENETLLGGWCNVWRKDRIKPISIEVTLSEYLQYDKDGKVTKFWTKMPCTMIRKVAFSQAHREAFPNDFGGLYDAAELEGPVIEELYSNLDEVSAEEME